MSEILPYTQASKLLTIGEKIAQSFMPAAYINDSEEEVSKIEDLIRNYHIGGICFFHSRASAATNFEGPKEIIYNEDSLAVLKTLIKRYQNASRYPLLISIDAEWGLAMRIENTPQYPYAITLGAMQDQEILVYQVGCQIGRDCQDAGIHWNFAPVADINNNPLNPVIGYRSFGESTGLVEKYSLAFCQGLQSSGVLTSAKHFPGHGDTATDSHLGLPLISKSRDQLDSNELRPFLNLIAAGVDSVMIGHLAVPVLSEGIAEPATVSKAIIQGFLRDEIGFDGVVVSDALNMHGVSKRFQEKGELEWNAYNAGTDVLCYTQHVIEGIHIIQNNASKEQIEEHFKRVWLLKEGIYKATEQPKPAQLESYGGLMTKLARQSLSRVSGNSKSVEVFRELGFRSLAIGNNEKSLFLEEVHKVCTTSAQCNGDNNIANIEEALNSEKRILLAIYPPMVKPINHFGVSREELSLIDRLSKDKDVILYLFGNPYFLNLLDLEDYSSVWAVYQDFPEFEQNAARHFLGEVDALGKLPITIEKN